MPARKKSDTPAKRATKKPTAPADSTAVESAPAARRKRATPNTEGGDEGPAVGGRTYDLVIIESVGKVKAISKYLGGGFKVLASFGHVRDLATNKDRKTKEEVAGIQIGAGWKLRYLTDAGAKAKAKGGKGGGKFGKRRTQQEILDELGAAAKNATRVLLASDPDREGESIAWHIADALQLDPRKTFRIRFNEITKPAIQKALTQIDQIDMGRVKSQEARRAMDRVVGFPLSNLLGKKVASGLSAGRVQSVAVRLIVDRDAEIDAFKTEEYWKVTALLAPQGSGVKLTVKPTATKLFAKQKGVATAAETPGKQAAPGELAADVGEEPEGEEAEALGSEPEASATAPKKGAEPKSGIPAPVKGTFLAELTKWDNAEPKLGSETEADAIGTALLSAKFVVTKVEQKDRQDRPQPPFITSTLQRQANGRLRFSTKRTMDAAQRLYQGIDLRGEGTVALITYMRTDSTRISPDAVTAVRAYIEQTFGPNYRPDKPNFYASGKNAQEAHECIRPTDVTMTPERASSLGLGGDDLRVYTLIYNRFVACQMSPAVFAVTTVEITAGKGLFRASGRVEKFDGYRRVMASAGGKDEEPQLPPLAANQPLDRYDLYESQHFTQPPPRFNEGSLVEAMVKAGIGRPSTYSSIIEVIQNRGYVEQKERRFFATQVGKTVTHLLVAHFPKVMDMKFTSHFEEELDEIETGKFKYADVLDEFWNEFSVALTKAETDMPAQRGIEIGEDCPKCGKALVAMFSRKTGNKFIGCSGWKDPENPCPYKRGEDGTESMGPEVTTIPCPACGKFMVKKDGRYGVFYTCEGAPDCPTIMNAGADGKPVVSTLPSKYPCPKCKKPLLLKFSKTGNRYVQCSDAKGCSFISDADEQGAPIKPPDTGINCEKCGQPMVIKKSFRGPFLACTGYPKCRGTKAINAELREKLKDILPKEEPKKAGPALPHIDIPEPCTDCGSPMKLKQYMGRYFLSCSKYPACKGSRKPTPEQLAQIAAATQATAGG